jgi:tetratricopeptide (TPR) repeat protein
MRLIEAGLRGDEADELLDQLKSEFERGALGDEQEYRRFLRQQVKELKVNPTPARGEKWQNRLETVLLALFSSGLYDLLKGAFESPPRAPSSECERHLPIQWIRAESASAWSGNEYLFRRVVGIKRTAQSLTSLAMCLDAQGHYAEAESLFLEAYDIDSKVCGSEHRAAGVALVNLGVNIDAQGRHVEAERILRRGLEIVEQQFGPVLHTAAALYDLGVNLAAQNRHVEAEPLLNRALQIAEKTLGPDAKHTIAVRERLRATLAALRWST